jgi:alpha-maltose-1-phosphate synthase
MRVAVLSREYPPEVYGGAGVHVEFLVRELRRLVDVEVHCFGADRAEPGVRGYPPPPELARANSALRTIGTDVEIAAALDGSDVLHSHTWYANLAGVLGSRLHDIPHVLTAHSLEPQRPWKAEQLGGGYRLALWAERQAYETADAVVAVSYGMRADVLDAYPFVDPAKVHVIHNGIDTAMYSPVHDPERVAGLGVDPTRPSAIFVGRITRLKGL